MKKDISVLLDEHVWLKQIIGTFSNLFFSVVRFISKTNKTGSKTIVISMCRIGDSVFTIPTLRAIISSNDNVIVVCFRDSKTIYDLFLTDVNYIVIDKSEIQFNGRIINSKYRNALNKINPKRIYDITGSILSASLIFGVKTDQVIGFNDIYFKRLYSKFIPKRKLPHLMEMYFEVALAGDNTGHLVLKREFSTSYNKSDKILIHPFAGWEAKEWNMQKFIELTELFNKDFNVSWIFADDKKNEVMKNNLDTCGIKYIITESLERLLKEIETCSLFISNDSGPLYLAASLGKPTFTIYGPTNPAYSIPYGQNHRSIRKSIHCSPEIPNQYCFTFGGRYCDSFECMNSLHVKDVYDEIVPFIDSLKISKQHD
jgi:ADP-heptose:LPS heptosyltransferase